MCLSSFNILLPIRTEWYWIVRDELKSVQKQAIIDLGKFALHDLEIDRVTIVAASAAAGVGAIAAYLGIGIILSILSGGGSLPVPIDVTAINTNINMLLDMPLHPAPFLGLPLGTLNFPKSYKARAWNRF